MAKNLVIFAHGFLGFKEKFGIKYWNGAVEYVKKRLDKGLARVEATEVSPTGGTQERASVLAGQITDFLEGDTEVIHIIGHSMGGLDARRLVTPGDKDLQIHKKLNKPVTITTVSTPHRGSPLADFGYEILVKGKNLDQLLGPRQKEIEQLATALEKPASLTEGFLKKLIESIKYLEELKPNNWKGLEELTTWGAKVFNQKFSDSPPGASPLVRYFSYGGVAWPFAIQGDYLPDVLIPGWLIIYLEGNQKNNPKEKENDSNVSLHSSEWGNYKGDLPAYHAEQVGFRFSFMDMLRCFKFKHKEFYLEIVKDLCTKGEPGSWADIKKRIGGR